MKKKCPCCQKDFPCRVDRIEFCNCKKIAIEKGVRDYIRENWNECICFECLKTVNESFNLSGINPRYKIP